jgi:SIT4-associating protein SAP185/190
LSQWLQSQDIIPILLQCLGPDRLTFTQTSAGDFLKAIITISANASQNEQSCIGPNSLTRQLVSEECIESLIRDMLRGGNPLTVGVGIIIEVIRKNNSDYDPDLSTSQDQPPSSSDPIYLGTLLRIFAKHVPDFMKLILSSTHTVSKGNVSETVMRKELDVAFGGSIEPLGFDRFKTCELMAELLHCSNMGLLNERGSEQFIKQRDKEREALREQGALLKSRHEQTAESGITDFSEDSSSMAYHGQREGSRSPEDVRKLEITNNAEDDGFEDVGKEEGLNGLDDEPIELERSTPSPVRPSKERLSLDDEFFDEPLTSPRLPPFDERNEGLYIPSLSSKAVVTPPAGAEAHTDPDPDATDALVNEITAQLPMDDAPDAPALPLRTDHLDVEDAEPAIPRDTSPHPDDKPAPLFAKKEDTAAATLTADGSQESVASMAAEVGDLEDQPFVPHMENDVDGRPIVGDYLKMMFVEHKVVPTILVSDRLAFLFVVKLMCVISRTFSSASPGTIFSTTLCTTLSSKSSTAQWTVVTTALLRSISFRPDASPSALSRARSAVTKLLLQQTFALATWAT